MLLCIGGELVVSTIYVNGTGVDDRACLNGGQSHPCKTLGYVLINIDLIQYNSCAIMIDYSHPVFCHRVGDCEVKLTTLKYLEIDGQLNTLNCWNKGIQLLGTNNTTVVVKNVILMYCNSTINARAPYIQLQKFCIYTDLSYHLEMFSLVNVVLSRNSANIIAAAKTITIHKCTFNSGVIYLLPPARSDYSYTISESIFNSSAIEDNVITLAIEHISSTFSGLGSIDISNNTFANMAVLPPRSDDIDDDYHYSMIFLLIDISHDHTFNTNFICTVCNNVIRNNGNQRQKINFIRTEIFVYPTHGELYLFNNLFINNMFSTGLKMLYCNPCLKFVCLSNKFINNKGHLMDFYQWPYIELVDTAIINNTADTYLVYIHYDKQHNPNTTIIIKNTIMMYNLITVLTTTYHGAIVNLYNSGPTATIYVTCGNVTFSKNLATPLALNGISLAVTGSIMFESNRGVTGGGLYIHLASLKLEIDVDHATVNVSFVNNFARYGGAIFIDNSQSLCFLNISNHHSLLLYGNTAIVGPSIFSSRNWCNFNFNDICTNLSVVSIPTMLTADTVSVFPGQLIVLNIVADCSSLLCIADVFLINCTDDNLCGRYGISLQGLPTVLVHTGLVYTGLAIKIENVSSYMDMQLQLKCESPQAILDSISPAVVTTKIHLLQCPFGLYLDVKSGVCQCEHAHGTNNIEFLCSDNAGKACVKKGYWYGNVSISKHDSQFTTIKCLNLFCNFSTKSKCPSNVASDSTNYILLSQSQDDQCLNGHGGPLCTACTEGKMATYGGLQCIPSHQCKSWHPYMLLLLNITCPFVIGVALLIIIQLRLSVGSGYLYGPLFYLATLNLIPFDAANIGTLNNIVKFFSATFLLKFQVLGFIPWCFFSEINLLYSTSFELIAPLVVTIVLLFTVYLARCVPRLFRRFQKSPVYVIGVLVLISFWSLASTSIQVITPVYLSGVNGARVNLKPDLLYLRGVHILFWIVAVILLLMLLIVTVALMVSPFVGLHRIKPMFDNLQSCYKDNIRWYSGMYFCIWTVLQSLLLTSKYQIFQTVIIILLATHCLLQPYSHKWLNIMDGFLLACLTITSSLQDYGSYDSSYTQIRNIIVYITTMVPLIFLVFGAFSIILARFGIGTTIKNAIDRYRKRKANTDYEMSMGVENRSRARGRVRRAQRPITPTHIIDIEPYREPLIYNCEPNNID